jgi:N-acetylmuramoyl-L-alanine amidase
MESTFYLIDVSVCIGVFYVVYLLLFKNRSVFILNRAYLIAGLIFSFIIPSLKLSLVPVDYHLSATSLVANSSLEELGNYYSPKSIVSKSIEVSFIATVYWIGFALSILRLLYDVIRVTKIRNRSVVTKQGGTKVLYADIEQPFSYFNMIFLPKNGINQLIFEHELAHVRRRHWLDLLVMEVGSALLWFNPIMILYRKSIRIQHEYEADAQIVTQGAPLESYLDCILSHLRSGNSNGLVSHFFTENIKQRILMMTRNNENRKFKLLYLLFAPLVCGLMLAFSSPIDKGHHVIQSLMPGDTNEILIVVDAGHGGHDAGTYRNKINEKGITLGIAKGIRKIGENKGIKVILTRSKDEAMSLEERISIASLYKADMFLSLHVNAHSAETAASGIDIFIGEGNRQFDKSNRVAEHLKRELSLLGGIKVNEVANSNFYVLNKNTVPSILLELGYLSNDADYAYIGDFENQERISEHIINAVIASVK